MDAKSAADVQKPRIILGTLTFGWANASSTVDDSAAKALIDAYLNFGGAIIDTARCYSDGSCEQMLGRTLPDAGVASGPTLKFDVDTKANPGVGLGLAPEGIRAQLKDSLDAMKREAVNVLYLHQPDTKADLSSTLATVHELVQQGLVRELGLSNYSTLEVQRCLDLCEQNNWTRPSVYQGIYNAVNRGVEEELLPLLRSKNMRFYAFSPMAGGLLCKRQSKENLPQKRVEDNPFYFSEECLHANACIADGCDDLGLSMLSASYSWLLHHSALQSSDGIVVGASSLQQLESVLEACKNSQKLPEQLVQVFDGCWEPCKSTTYPFWRLYSKDMPNGAELSKVAPGALFHC